MCRLFSTFALVFCLTFVFNTSITALPLKAVSNLVYINGSPKLLPNQFLTKDQHLKSRNGKFTLYYQADGNLVLYTNGLSKALWSSRTNGTTPGKCIMQGDGNLVIYNPANHPQWSSKTGGHPNQGIFLEVRDDGNVVVRRLNGQILWQTNTIVNPVSSNTLLAGKSLRPGQRLTSTNSRYFMNFQHDGNLVVYQSNPLKAIWNSHTNGKRVFSLMLKLDGNLVITGRTGDPNYPYVWQSHSGNPGNRGCRLVMEDSGRLMIICHRGIIWKTK